MQTDDDHYRITPFLHFNMGASSEVLYSMLSRKTVEVVRGTADRLRSLGTAQPLSAYAEALSTVTRDPGSLIHVLMEARIVASLGYLLDDGCSESRAQPRTAPAAISCIATPTRGRSQLLPVSFGSYLADLREYGHTPDLLIADDSTDETARRTTLNIVEEMVKVADRPIVYADSVDKLLFIQALANECDVPASVLRFGLLGDSRFSVTTGANRNGIALYAAGSLLLTVDDDSQCQPICMSQTAVRDSIKFGGGTESPSTWRAAEKAEAALDDNLSGDIVGQHEIFLGKTLRDVAAEHRSNLELNRYCDSLLMDLSKDRGKIVITFTGVAGDSGMRSTAPIAMQRWYETQLTAENELQYSEDLTRRDVVRHFSSATICRRGFPMTTAVGIDHRVLLPPFLPVCRNQDGLFIASVKRIHPHAYFAHLPFALTHKPGVIRKNDPAWTSSTRIADQIMEYIAAWPEPPRQQAADTRCSSLGEFLIGISCMSRPDFEEMTRILLLRRATRLINDCETAMAHYDRQPAFWARDLSDRITEIRQATIHAEFTAPCDLAALFSSEHLHDATQLLLRQFGELLCWWPEIVKITKNLADGGLRLGRLIKPH